MTQFEPFRECEFVCVGGWVQARDVLGVWICDLQGQERDTVESTEGANAGTARNQVPGVLTGTIEPSLAWVQ